MKSKYTVTIVAILMILALSRGFVLHYHDFISFGALTALADGDGGGGDGGGGDGGGGDGGGGDGGGGDGGGTCTDDPQTPVSCATYAGQYGIPAGYTVGEASWTFNSCTQAITYTGGCSAPPAACYPWGNTLESGQSVQYYDAETVTAPATCTGGTFTCINGGLQGYTAGMAAFQSCTVVQPPPVCEDVPQTPVACATYAGQYGIPAGYTVGQASWTFNTCTQAVTYTGGCSAPPPTATITQSVDTTVSGTPFTVGWGSTNATSCTVDMTGPDGVHSTVSVGPTSGGPFTVSLAMTGQYSATNTCIGPGGSDAASMVHTVTAAPVCSELPQTPVSCNQDLTQYGVPAGYTVGQASWTYNTCTQAVTYTGGCSAPTWVNYCTGANDPHPWQIWAYSNETPPGYRFIENGSTANGCVAPPVCADVPQTPVSCAAYAGQYGIPADHTVGQASWTWNSCTNTATYTGGCTVPPPVCNDVPQTPVSCNQDLTQYGVPAGYTVGQASWTLNSCTQAIHYTGGCSAPAPTCALSTSPSSIQVGNSSLLTWITSNATSLSIDHGIGMVSPASGGSQSIAPTTNTTYTGTVVGVGGSASCTAPITVTQAPPPPALPTCTLSISPTSIQAGGSATINWTNANATSFDIDHGVGSIYSWNVTPQTSGSVTVHPTVTTTYTGAVTNNGGFSPHQTGTCSVTITVTQVPPPTCTLGANPSSIQSGGSSTLSWSTTNTTSFSINQGIGSVAVPLGSRSVSPTVTTTYTGTATGAGGSVTCATTVTVTQAPPPPSEPTCTLTVTPSSIQSGGSSTLSWTTNKSDASVSMVIDQGIGAVPISGGSRTVSPTVTTTYTGIIIDNYGFSPHHTGSCTATVTVTSPPPPNVPTCTLSASPASIQVGDAATLNWTNAHATAFEIDHGVGTIYSWNVTPQTGGSVIVHPTVTTTYTGVVTDNGGFSPHQTGTCSVTVVVTSPPPPPSPTCTLSANPSAIQVGNSSTLSWSTANATSFSINQGIGSVAVPLGSRSVSPTVTTTYTGTATGAGGSVTCSTTVTVTQSPPPPTPSCTLTANPTSIQSGNSSTLSWSVSNTPSNYEFAIDHIGVVSTNGSPQNGTNVVSPTVTTTYTGTMRPIGLQFSPPPPTYTCSVTITVTPIPVPPTCALSANPTTIESGDSSSLSWDTTGDVTSFTIDHGVDTSCPPPGMGLMCTNHRAVSPTTTTTYTGTVTGPGGTRTCTATVTVVPPHTPVCTLTASPASIHAGDQSDLSWTTSNITSLTIDQGVGNVTPVASGTRGVTPSVTTTYTATGTGPRGTTTCTTTVTVLPPAEPTCTLSANPTIVSSGGVSTLTWTTTNADTFSIDHGIGGVSPAVGGTVSTQPITANTTFTGTVVSPYGHRASCTVTVTVQSVTNPPTCSLTVSPSSYETGGSATLAWSGNRIANVDIDNGIATATSTPGSTTVAPTAVGDYTYTGTFHTTSGQTLTCTAKLTVTPALCRNNCGGGGGGGGGTSPTITLAALPHVGVQSLAYLYLSQIPYTGLDLGPLGTTLYWLALVGWAFVIAYLVLFSALPRLSRRMQSFGAQVSEALNALPVRESQPAAVKVAPSPVAAYTTHETQEAPRGYSSYDGFKSFAQGGALSIDDIVKGLARSHPSHAVPEQKAEPVSHAQPAQQVEPIRNVEPVYQQVEPIYENVEPIRNEVSSGTAVASAPTHIRGFIAALVEGDRAAVFAGLRQHVRGGGSPEQLISQIVCLLDDAFRARIDGTDCDADVVRMTARLNTPTLERLIASLTNAIDSSYSTGVTGAKLALTRALATLGA